MAFTKEQWQEKVSALLNKANDPSLSSEEAETFFAKAAALMEKHDLTNEDLRQQTAKANGQEATDEKIVRWSLEIDTLGGHGRARISTLYPVARAMGAQAFFSQDKSQGSGYRVKTMLTVIGHESVVENLKLFLPTVLMRAEVLGEAHGKQAIREARKDGTLYSNTGCHARRGFMRGFGEGVASRIRNQRDAEVSSGPESFALILANRKDSLQAYMDRHYGDMKSARSHKTDGRAYSAGKSAGTAFGSPGVSSTGRRALGA